MIRVAICEDEKNIRDYLAFLVKSQSDRFEISVELMEYSSAEDYISDKKEYDVLFLDIELEGNIDGMELAKRIRGYSYGEESPVIIFVTGYEKYVYEAFDVSAFHFLVKPISEDKFSEVYERAIKKLLKEKNKKQSIMIPHNNGKKIIPISEIYYAESQDHKVIVHTYNGDLEYYGKMQDLENELSEVFFRIHRSCLINLLYVEEYSKNEVVITNGDILLISKYKYPDFVKAYLRFVRDEGISYDR